MNTIGVIIARFQTPYLHVGHKELMDSVRKNHNTVVVVLGVSPVRGSRKNPLDFQTREKMIKREYPEVIVFPLSDQPVDVKWSQNLDTLLSDSFPGSGFKLFGSRDSFIPRYSGKYEVIELPETSSQSSTLIREQISSKVLDSEEFRTGVIYAYSNTYLKVYPTVDIAVYRNNKSEILLGKKGIDNKWRLLGGFTDPADMSYEDAARRELTEECGAIDITQMTYEKSFRVNDWRYRSESDKIISALFSTDYVSGYAKGSDDIGEVRWFAFNVIHEMLKQNLTADEHTPQLLHLISKYSFK